MSQGYVLAVDDEPAIRFVYQEYLEGSGHRVRGAEDGQTALRHARLETPMLALVDLNLPDMSGLAVIRELRVLYPELPIVVISATPRDCHQAELEQLGVHGFLEKPVDLLELERVIARLLNR